MRISSLILLMATITLFACGGPKTTPNGLSFETLKNGDGPKPQTGEYAFLHVYVYMDGKLTNSTRQIGKMQPVKMPELEEIKRIGESGRPNYLLEALSVMSLGDSILLTIPVTEEMKENPQMANVQHIEYHVVLADVKTDEEFKADQEAVKIQRQAEINAVKVRESEVAAKMTDIVKQYTGGALNSSITTTSSGLKYLVLNHGNGPKVESGQQVDVHYYGTLTSGEMFDNSFKRGQPYSVRVGNGNVIKGWDEGLALLNKGDQAVFFIPSNLGYGKAGQGAIPGDAELIFYIEILE